MSGYKSKYANGAAVDAALDKAVSAVQPNTPISALSETATAKILTADERDVIDNLSALIAPDVTLVVARSLGAL